MKKAQRLLIPYLVFTLWGALGWVGQTIILHDTKISQLYNWLIGKGELNIPLWFIIVLFEIFCLANVIALIKNRTIEIIISFALSVISYTYLQGSNTLFSLYHFNAALFCLPYFYIGYLAKDFILHKLVSINKLYILFCMIAYCVIYYIFKDYAYVNRNVINWQYIPLVLFVLFSSILLLYICSRNILKWLIHIFIYIGKRSLEVFGLHLPIMCSQYFIINLTPSFTVNALLLAVLTLIECLILSNLIHKYCPQILGLKKTEKEV